jgi:hypothetical protein
MSLRQWLHENPASRIMCIQHFDLDLHDPLAELAAGDVQGGMEVVSHVEGCIGKEGGS